MDFPPYVPSNLSAHDALSFVMTWLDSEQWSDDRLAACALTQMEPLVDQHWDDLADDLIELMSTRRDLCRVVQGSVFGPKVPDDVKVMLHRAADYGPVAKPSRRRR